MEFSAVMELLQWALAALGLLAIPMIRAIWKVFKEGYEAHQTQIRYAKLHGEYDKWSKETLVKYAQQQFEFWEALEGFWKTLWKGVKKIFTKSGK